jgi:hypothetical protein
MRRFHAEKEAGCLRGATSTPRKFEIAGIPIGH